MFELKENVLRRNTKWNSFTKTATVGFEGEVRVRVRALQLSDTWSKYD